MKTDLSKTRYVLNLKRLPARLTCKRYKNNMPKSLKFYFRTKTFVTFLSNNFSPEIVKT